jgi:hypothetical protein
MQVFPGTTASGGQKPRTVRTTIALSCLPGVAAAITPKSLSGFCERWLTS